MNEIVINLATEECSKQLAAQLVATLSAPLVLTFRGEIGAGKTTFIRAMLKTMGVCSAIKSPTFSLVESYSCVLSHDDEGKDMLPAIQMHHFDLYRIHDEAELDFIGFRDYFTTDAICCIEWPQRVTRLQDWVDMDFSLIIKGAGREMTIRAFSSAGIHVLSSLAGAL